MPTWSAASVCPAAAARSYQTQAPSRPRPGPAYRMPRLKAASTLPASAALENHGSAPAASPTCSSSTASALAASRCPA